MSNHRPALTSPILGQEGGNLRDMGLPEPMVGDIRRHLAKTFGKRRNVGRLDHEAEVYRWFRERIRVASIVPPENPDRPVVVFGPPGSGKSPVLCQPAMRRIEFSIERKQVVVQGLGHDSPEWLELAEGYRSLVSWRPLASPADLAGALVRPPGTEWLYLELTAALVKTGLPFGNQAKGPRGKMEKEADTRTGRGQGGKPTARPPGASRAGVPSKPREKGQPPAQETAAEVTPWNILVLPAQGELADYRKYVAGLGPWRPAAVAFTGCDRAERLGPALAFLVETGLPLLMTTCSPGPRASTETGDADWLLRHAGLFAGEETLHIEPRERHYGDMLKDVGGGLVGHPYSMVWGFLPPQVFRDLVLLSPRAVATVWLGRTADELVSAFAGRCFDNLAGAVLWFSSNDPGVEGISREVAGAFALQAAGRNITTHFGAGMIPSRQTPSSYTRLTAFLAPVDPARPPLPPAARDLEPTLLGLLLGDWSAGPRILERLTPEDFSDPRHRLIFQTVKSRFGGDRRKTHSPVLWLDACLDIWASRGQAGDIGGEEYLSELERTNPMNNSARFVDRLIRDLQAMGKARTNEGAEK